MEPARFDGHLFGQLFGKAQPCFGCGPDHPHGMRLVLDRVLVGERPTMRTEYTANVHQQGPPGIMHGGLVATLADEVAAWATVGILNRFGFTVAFSGRLRKAVRIGIPIVAESWITSDRKRLVDVEVSLRQENEEAFSGKFTFALLDRAGAEKLLGGPLPESWEQFCRA